MDKRAMFTMVADQRVRLCDQLDDLSLEQWDAPSLCAGWRIRDVLAHLVTLQDIPTWKFLVGVVGMGGFHRRVDRFAREYGQREPAELVSRYRQLAGSPNAPPIVGPIAPLADIVVHALDIERPLGLDPVHSDEMVVTALDALCAGLPGFTSKKLVRGLRFEAPDIGWTLGAGPVVRGVSSDLLLTVTGRVGFANRLEGDGAPLLLARLP